MTNPYQSPLNHSSVGATPDWECDQCPVCLCRHSRFRVLNSLRYECERCSTRLVVSPPPGIVRWIRHVLIFGVLIFCVVANRVDDTLFHEPPLATCFLIITGIALVVGIFWIPWRYGYIYPHKMTGLKSRRELDQPTVTNDRRDGG